jgi:hypothetical protein
LSDSSESVSEAPDVRIEELWLQFCGGLQRLLAKRRLRNGPPRDQPPMLSSEFPIGR